MKSEGGNFDFVRANGAPIAITTPQIRGGIESLRMYVPDMGISDALRARDAGSPLNLDYVVGTILDTCSPIKTTMRTANQAAAGYAP